MKSEKLSQKQLNKTRDVLSKLSPETQDNYQINFLYPTVSISNNNIIASKTQIKESFTDSYYIMIPYKIQSLTAKHIILYLCKLKHILSNG